jgi:excisionase family DNA binding protein
VPNHRQRSSLERADSLADSLFNEPDYCTPAARLLSVHEVASHLGVSVVVVRQLIRNKKLLAAKVGGQWRIRQEDLTDFIIAQLPTR